LTVSEKLNRLCQWGLEIFEVLALRVAVDETGPPEFGNFLA
jgi:hypothetical protein